MTLSSKKHFGIEQKKVTRLTATDVVRVTDDIAVEEPLEIRIGDEAIAVTMRTPGADEDLAAGFCFTEGIVNHADEIESIKPCDEADYGNVVVVHLTGGAAVSRESGVDAAKREMYLSSSCGLCGKQTIDRIYQKVEKLDGGVGGVDTEVLYGLPGKLEEAQEVFAKTGGLHAAGLFDAAGELLVLREDVGRHNAVDKVIGRQILLGRWPMSDLVLVVSGRAGFEIVQKAAVAGIGVMAAVGAPSSLAVELADRVGMTLVGFLRRGQMNVYTHEKRISGLEGGGNH